MRIYRLKELTELLGISKATIYAWMKKGDFPQSVSLGANSVGWKESDVQHWIESRSY